MYNATPPESTEAKATALRVLVLGGTAAARQLAEQLHGLAGIAGELSLAGRTLNPAAQPLPTRHGGFGGAAGLACYLRQQHIAALVVATHPFAAQIAWNAAAAAEATGTPLLRLLPPAWQPQQGDCWDHADGMAAVPALLGQRPRRVLLTIGRQQLAPFAQAPQHHYLIRSVEPLPAELALPHARSIQARGPFSLSAEIALMQREAIEVLVTKNSGSQQVAAKLMAARQLGVRVIMVERPATPAMPTVTHIQKVLDWVREQRQQLLYQ